MSSSVFQNRLLEENDRLTGDEALTIWFSDCANPSAHPTTMVAKPYAERVCGSENEAMRPMRPMPRLPNHVISPSKSFQLQLYQSQLLKYSRDFRKTQETPLPLQLQHPRPLDSGHHHALHLMCQRSLKPTLRARKQHGDFGRDLRCRFRWSPITFVFGSRKKINHKADSLQTTKAG